MGMEFSSTKLRSGRPAVFIRSSGQVSGEDAERVKREVGPNGQYHGLPMLTTVEPETNFSMEARKGFADMGDATADYPVAVVLTSAPMRLIIHFIVKASNLKRERPTNLKFFSDESAAMKWLDSEAQRLADAPKGAP
mgnify:CR=1 FL=1